MHLNISPTRFSQMSLNIYDQFQQMTPQEQQYVLTHPHHSISIKRAKEAAYAETKKVFGYNGKNDKSDAFRHCFWSALLARDIGYSGALQFTTAHESWPLNPAAEKKMDLHNNLVGLSIGRVGATNQVISQRCMAALMTGKLKVLI